MPAWVRPEFCLGSLVEMNGDVTQLSPVEAEPPPVLQPASGVKRVGYLLAGLVAIGMAYLGVLLPGLPTTPWVLLASYCFARSSPRLQRWIRRTPVFSRLIREWERHRGIRRPVKVVAVCLVLAVVTASIVFGPLPVWLKWVIGGFAAIGISVIMFVVPTARPEK